MEENKKVNFFDQFSRYNAENEGDIDIIKPKAGSTRPPLKYLKWMRGWIEVLKVDPEATYEPILTQSGDLLHRVGTGAMVAIKVTVLGHPKVEWYPVESAPMQSVPFDNITPTQVNKAIKRGMVKCLAQFGLASNLYLNDELTETEKDEISDDITSLIASSEDRDTLIAIYNANKALIDKTPRLLKLFQARAKEL